MGAFNACSGGPERLSCCSSAGATSLAGEAQGEEEEEEAVAEQNVNGCGWDGAGACNTIARQNIRKGSKFFW